MTPPRLSNLASGKGVAFHRLVSACVFLALAFTAVVCLWFYYANTHQLLIDSAKDHTEQQRKITQLILNDRQTTLKTLLTRIQQDQQLRPLIEQHSAVGLASDTNQATDNDHTRQVHQRLTELLAQHSTELDLLLYLPVRNGKEILAGHSEYQLDHLIGALKSHLPNLGSYTFAPDPSRISDKRHQATGLAYGVELVGGPLNKRLGFLYAIELFNGNVQFLKQIVRNTGVSGATLLVRRFDASSDLTTEPSTDASRKTKAYPIVWVNPAQTPPLYQPDEQHPDEQFSRFSLLDSPTPLAFTASLPDGVTATLEHSVPTPLGQADVELVLWQSQSYLVNHQQSFTRTMYVVIALVLLLGFGLALLATRISSQSLAYLTSFAKQGAQDGPGDEFKATPIYEINQVGQRLQQALQDLAFNEAMYRNILNNSGSVVYIKTLDGCYQFVNSEFESVTGLSLDYVMGKTNEELFPADVAKEYTDHDNKVIKEMRPLNFREDLVKDGETFSFITVKFPVQGQDGTTKYICGFSTDITGIIQTQQELTREKARAETATSQLNSLNKSLAEAIAKKTLELEKAQESLVQSEKLASLGALIAGLSHELNTPIGTALTVTSTMESRVDHLHEDFKSGALSKRAMENYLHDLHESGVILNRSLSAAIELISSFKQLSVDQTSAQRRRFDLRKTLDEVTVTHRHLLSESPVQLITMVNENTKLDSYPGALTQVLNNLINNAIKHAFDDEQAGTISITATRQQDQVIINVSDNGQGIPINAQRKVFDPFFTTKMGQGGTGLGLHIVHSIVTGILGGSITLNSRCGGVNSGTDFRIALPLIAPDLQQEQGSPLTVEQ
jgi:PAS domain S-box-containing protein